MKFNRLIPELCVSDIQRSLCFYTQILGFKVEYQREETKFAFISCEGAQLMLEENPNSPWSTGKQEYPFGRGINFQIEVKNLDHLLERLKKNNYPIKSMPTESWYRQGNKLLGVKEMIVLDPDGYLLRFLQSIGQKSA